jgi:hypothetical protein
VPRLENHNLKSDDEEEWDNKKVMGEVLMETKHVSDVALQTSWFHILSINKRLGLS